MVACYEGDEPPPAPLFMAWQCERWHALPAAGGMLDQEYKLMRSMTACVNVYNAVSHLRSAHGEQIHSLSDGEREILGSLVRMGLLFNGQ